MKFIHIADLHLGANPDAGKRYSAHRAKEIWDTFEKVIQQCEKKQIDLLLIAGDLFHRQPLLRELKEVDYLFQKLTKTKVVLIAGNHDYMKWDSYYRTFQWSKNVFPLFGDRLQCAEFPELETAVYGLSYHKREIKENVYEKAKPWKKQKCEILLAHGGDEKHIPLQKAGLLALGYDYIALGHIHKPGIVEEDKILYAGALEPIDKNDTGVHGYVYGVWEQEKMHARFIPFAMREYIHMNLPVNKNMTQFETKDLLKQKIQEQGIQNIYKVILTGFRGEYTVFDTDDMDPFENVLEVVDETKPAYRFDKLQEENRDNLLGNYIEALSGFPKDSIEYMALYEGVEALLETKRG